MKPTSALTTLNSKLINGAVILFGHLLALLDRILLLQYGGLDLKFHHFHGQWRVGMKK